MEWQYLFSICVFKISIPVTMANKGVFKENACRLLSTLKCDRKTDVQKERTDRQMDRQAEDKEMNPVER